VILTVEIDAPGDRILIVVVVDRTVAEPVDFRQGARA
jgi:hypothetical protein